MKQKIVNSIIAREGGYVNDPNDSGGETNFGITVKVARENGYTGKMIDMLRAVAEEIYGKQYWDAVQGDQLVFLSEKIADEVTDTAVNMGVHRAATFLQRALNVLNDNGKHYENVTVDGNIGAKTLDAVYQYLLRRDEIVLLRVLNSLQGAFYVDLAERREKDKSFIYGWFKHRVII
jgi:lysozyme family protein